MQADHLPHRYYFSLKPVNLHKFYYASVHSSNVPVIIFVKWTVNEVKFHYLVINDNIYRLNILTMKMSDLKNCRGEKIRKEKYIYIETF
jgi:hypothetical protein